MQGIAPRGMSTPSELCVIDYRLSLNFPRQAVAVYALSSAQLSEVSMIIISTKPSMSPPVA